MIESLEAGKHIEELGVDAGLPEAVKAGVAGFHQSVDVLLRALRGDEGQYVSKET